MGWIMVSDFSRIFYVSDIDISVLDCFLFSLQEAMSTMKRKEHLVKQFEETTVELLKDAPDSTTSPVVKELEKLKKSFVSVQNQLLDMKGILDEGLKDLLELHNLLAELYKVMDDIDECIAKSSDALDGDEHDLESCLNVSVISA